MTHTTSGRDPMGWQYELKRALEDPALAAFERPELPDPEAVAAAYRLALCLGYCRLLKVDLPDQIDGILPPHEAIAAAEELTRHVDLWIKEAQQLPSRWDAGPLGTEDEYCADLLQARMDAWAAFLAISEAHEDCVVQHEEAAKEFDRAIDQLLAALDRFDETLQEPEVLALLSTLAGTPLLENWRRMLAIPDGKFLPWWLDGTLEEESRRIEADVAAFAEEFCTPRRLSSAPQCMPSSRGRHLAAAIKEIQIVAALAAEPSDEEPPVPVILRWASPDGRWIARLSCPNRVAPGGRLPLEFLSLEGRPAAELSGWPVWLAGQEERIDAQGVARFDLQKLQTAVEQPSQRITLEVGAEPVEWAAIQSE